MKGSSLRSQVLDGRDIFTDLWQACAGHLVTIPSVGDRVFYFPQGHIEQVETCANQDFSGQIPLYNLPSTILCRVVNIQLKAERETDEVFAQVTLLPEPEQEDSDTGEETIQPTVPKPLICYFCKILTASDTCTHGGFSIRKKHANECLPPLDMSQQPPTQDLKARDLHGAEWTFRHIFRGQPKRHLLTTGWSTFMNAKKLAKGDAFIFLRGEKGELCVGVRHAMQKQRNGSTSVMSGHSMQVGVLASASHAINTGTMFTVYYWPRRSPEFIVGYNRYVESIKNKYSVGMRFWMSLEGEEAQEQRFTGTIIGVEVAEPATWPDSKWRCYEVQWDENGNPALPDRVSPWNIIPLEAAAQYTSVLSRPKKRRATHCRSAMRSSVPRRNGPTQVAGQPVTNQSNGVSQGQEKMVSGVKSFGNSDELGKPQVSPSLWLAPQSSGAERTNELVDYLRYTGIECCTHTLRHKPPYKVTPLSNSCGLIKEHSNVDCHWSLECSSSSNPCMTKELIEKPIMEPIVGISDIGARHFDPHGIQEVEFPISKSRGGSMFRIFGVNVIENAKGPPVPHVVTSDELQGELPVSLPQVAVVDSDQLSEPSKSCKLSESSGSGGYNGQPCVMHPVTARSCTKVHKQGTALGRSVDLSRFNGYEELIIELDQLFEFEGGLVDQSKGWQVIYTDDEGDIMMIGDDPWQEFCSMVRKIHIYPKEAIEKLKPGT